MVFFDNLGKIPAAIYLLKVNNRSTRIRCEICSKITIKKFIVNFGHISHLVLVFLSSASNMKLRAGNLGQMSSFSVLYS